jgi:glycosyltransferase involved in cell wall biosynthesis
MTPASVVVVHNFYRQPGGEDHSVSSEINLLESYGVKVIPYFAHNSGIGPDGLIQLGVNTIWNERARVSFLELLRKARPNLVHVHNTFPLLSPAIYYAAHSERIPVVQSFHNFRTICANGLFFRSGSLCEDCTRHRLPWPAVLHRCYRGSAAASAAVASMLAVHRWKRTWSRLIHSYIASSDLAKSKFVSAGIDETRITVKPNFLELDPGIGMKGAYAVFAGRLSGEKGFPTVIEAWRRLPIPLELRILGDGPLADAAARLAAERPNVRFLGYLSRAEVLAQIGTSRFVIFASECYESAHPPLAIIEALAQGVPVLASEFAGNSRGIRHQDNGLVFRAGDPADLVSQIRWFISNPDAELFMRTAARLDFERRYTRDNAYSILAEVYSSAMRSAQN